MFSKKRSNESSDENVKKKKKLPLTENKINIPIDDAYLRSGKILVLKLVNFMCHKNFEIDFGTAVQKNASLIIGNNGSGKSAILTAILIGLGRRAMETDRTTNLKELVRKGETTASIEIHLSNDGVDQYSVEQYGRRIIIIRTISINGTSKYKILNERKEIVSHHKNDLDNILLLLNIQINNPICVLTQFLSKAFLINSDPSKRYKLFMNGTQLAQIRETINFCKEKFTKINLNLSNKVKKSENLAAQIEIFNDKIISLSSIGNLENQISLYKIELAWFDVNEEEIKIKINLEKHKEELQEREKLKNSFENRDACEREIKNKINDYAKQIEVLKKKNSSSNQAFIVIKANLDQENNKLHDLNKVQKRLEEKRQLTESNIKKLEINLVERKANAQNNATKMNEEKIQKLNELDKAKKENVAIKENVNRDIRSLNNTLEQYRDDKAELNAELEILKRKKLELESRLRVNSNSGTDNLTVYSQNMPNLIKAIDTNYKNGKFSKMPLGPLGRYIEVPDEKWRGLVEYSILRIIKSFAVNSYEDRDLLFSLIRKHCPNEKYTIIQSKFFDKIHDVNKTKVHAPYSSICFMNILKVNNPNVMNILIDQMGIENILTVVDESLATKLTSKLDDVPRNLTKLYLLNPLSEYYPQPSYRTYGINKRNYRFLQVDMSRHREQMQNEISQIDTNIAHIYAKLKELNKKIDELKKSILEKNSIMSTIDSKLIKIRFEIEEIKNIEIPVENEIDILENEKNELENALITINESLNACKAKMMTIQEAIIALKKQKEIISTQDASTHSQINEINENINAENINLTRIATNAKYVEKRYKEKCNYVLEIEKQLEAQNKTLNKLINDATLVGAKKEITFTSRELLLNKIDKLQHELRKIVGSNQDTNIDELKMMHEKSQIKYNELTTLINRSNKTKDKLQAARHKRKEFLHLLENHMRTRITSEFKGLVEMRDYDGYIKIDHNKQILDMHIIPRDKHIKDAVSSIDSLSGGERSFTTLALLLSLWKCVNFPFFCLDEYDVFTDEYTRKLMNSLLFHHAARHKNRQYIFLTPLDMSQMDIKNHINIIKLNSVRQETRNN